MGCHTGKPARVSLHPVTQMVTYQGEARDLAENVAGMAYGGAKDTEPRCCHYGSEGGTTIALGFCVARPNTLLRPHVQAYLRPNKRAGHV
jgi:hypothetical protein